MYIYLLKNRKQDVANLLSCHMHVQATGLIVYLPPPPHPHWQLTVAKSPLSSCESFVVGIEDKGLVLDWGATGK